MTYTDYAKEVAEGIAKKWFPVDKGTLQGKQGAVATASKMPSIYRVYVHDNIRTPNDIKLVKGSELFKLNRELTIHDNYLLNENMFSIQNIENREYSRDDSVRDL